MPGGGERFIINFLFGKTQRTNGRCSQADSGGAQKYHSLSTIIEKFACGGYDRISTGLSVHPSMQWARAEGSGLSHHPAVGIELFGPIVSGPAELHPIKRGVIPR